MTLYVVTVERIDDEQETEPKWMRNVKDGNDAYVTPPAGVMKRVTTKLFEQKLPQLDIPQLARFINGGQA